jgi:hypothetical protein
MDATLVALRRALAGNAAFWVGAIVLQGGTVGLAVRLARDGVHPGSAVPGVLLQVVVSGAGIVLLLRAARAARVGAAGAAQSVVLAFAAIVMVGAVATFFAGLSVLAFGAAVAGGMTEGAGFLAVALGPCLAWFVALAASPMGAAAYEPTRQLRHDEVVRSQRVALVMASASVIAATLTSGEGWPLLFLPLSAAIGAATGLLRARSASQDAHMD